MKKLYVILLMLITLPGVSQLRPVESKRIAVNYTKTVHLIFPTPIKYFQSVTDFVAVDNPENVPHLLRIKANQKSFNKETTVSVATEGGIFYSFQVLYSDSLAQTNYIIPGMNSVKADTVYVNEVAQTHIIAPGKVVYIDYGDNTIKVSRAENTENIVRLTAGVPDFPQTNLSMATKDGKFYTYDVNYKPQPEIYVYQIGEQQAESKASVILTDNVIPAVERDSVVGLIYNSKRGIFNLGIVKNKITFSVNNINIHNNILFLTFELTNKSQISYDIDYVRYYIVDKKTAKLTASQEVDQIPLFTSRYTPRIPGKSTMKYISAFSKFTIPDDKVFRIEISESNGGRHIIFDLENDHIVNVVKV